jgi:hypothetical protein
VVYLVVFVGFVWLTAEIIVPADLKQKQCQSQGGIGDDDDFGCLDQLHLTDVVKALIMYAQVSVSLISCLCRLILQAERFGCMLCVRVM